MRVILPENNGCPMIIEHEDFLENEDITLNLKFENYELNYGFEECDCGSGCTVGVTHLTVKRDGKIIFSESFNHNWVLFLDISKKYSRFKIDVKIYNADDGDTCEICENNRFNFSLSAVVDTYVYCFYSPPLGEFKKHVPEEPGELDEKIKEELK